MVIEFQLDLSLGQYHVYVITVLRGQVLGTWVQFKHKAIMTFQWHGYNSVLLNGMGTLQMSYVKLVYDEFPRPVEA